MIFAHVLILSLKITLAFNKVGFLIRPRVRLLCIVEVHLVLWGPAVVLVVMNMLVTMITLVVDVLASKLVQLVHVAHLLDGFPLKFAF